MWWLLWILTILAVIGTQIYTTRTVIRTRFRLNELLKRVARAKMDEKVARSNLEVSNRELITIQRAVAAQEDAVEKLKETITTLEQERKKRLQETKNRLAH
ncbi:MAG: hypothetical protein A3F84_20470 [Candidatus Handelsmanbacteria bacterium RIFCSPLOWO2_12_FULL_64_10]|uniref:Uncharacterized protein n=1 Tax=Handelsmanbacteria sp. (strain RIFCSPLOWO2_12_FULL_64_10) TaxID=1817868 RepID=A0A1F6C437_HANXR|nr:MAG: hypothetical protein A3F84_20470 [Candidatus Handelsmanbacteria bacterium RIFCSPLOWO2_12_FULL_64_10]